MAQHLYRRKVTLDREKYTVWGKVMESQNMGRGGHALQLTQEPGALGPGSVLASGNDFLVRVQNSCLECNRALDRNEIKVIPPMYIQMKDSYVRNGMVLRRYMCVPCYNALRKPVRVRHRLRPASTQHTAGRRARIVRSLLSGMLFR